MLILRFLLLTSLLMPLLRTGCAPLPAGDQAETAVADLDAYPFTFLRDGQPIGEDEEVVSMIAVGDMLLGRGVAQEADPWRYSAVWLNDADITVGNLEGVLVDEDLAQSNSPLDGRRITLSGSPEAAQDLASSGFDMMNVANNHSLDFGGTGFEQSIAALQEAGLTVTGLETEGLVEPHIEVIDKVRIAFLAFNAVPDPDAQKLCPTVEDCPVQPANWDAERSLEAIWAARDRADVVVVFMHWGYEYQVQPDPFQETMAHTIFEAGADLIVGHHAHVPQSVRIFGSRVVAFNLGNFLFDQGGEGTDQGLALKAYFDEEGLRAVQVLPVKAATQPRLLKMEEAQSWLSAIMPIPKHIGFACTKEGCSSVDVSQSRQDHHFFAGRIDLTGDGETETVRREGERITVYEGETAVWQSPAEWRIVDVALGDPNDDGRNEIMLALWQEDEEGYERSQPYIVGYRGGRYDLLWGGRPVADPILELEVGDVDGDGADELVVIEQTARDDQSAVSVWRWAGWTFTQVWRSELGSYSDLILEDGENPVISVATIEN